MNIVVMKFGGTSVATPDLVKNVARLVARVKQSGMDPVVVVSAQGKTTDKLIGDACLITPNPNPREMDMLLSTGEQASSALLALAIQELGMPAISFTGWQAGICTDGQHQCSRIVGVNTDRICKELAEGKIVVVAGFQGITDKGEITTLERGGSDITAVWLAAALKLTECVIYTDVTGIFTADPHIVPEAIKLASVTYEGMAELAAAGAKFPLAAVELAWKKGVQLAVRSTFDQNEPGTVVGDQPLTADQTMVSISSTKKIAMITLAGACDGAAIKQRLFSGLAAQRINIDLISETQYAGGTSISFTVSADCLGPANEKAVAAARQFETQFETVKVESRTDVAKIAIVGAGMASQPGVAAAVFNTLQQGGIGCFLVSTSIISISLVVEQSRVEEAVRALHRALISTS
jgi:aspartate kinase